MYSIADYFYDYIQENFTITGAHNYIHNILEYVLLYQEDMEQDLQKDTLLFLLDGLGLERRELTKLFKNYKKEIEGE